MKLSQILENIEYSFKNAISLDTEITHIASRAEDITEDSLFVLVESINFNVKNILNYIRAKKPKIMLAEIEFCNEDYEFPVICVKNAREAMANVYSSFYCIDYSKIKIIGITGTNGKTSTATMLKEILLTAGKKTGFIGTGKIEIEHERISEAYYSMTTPDPSLLYKSLKEMQDCSCEYVVMEASSHALYLDKLAPISFELAIFTNLSEEHLDFHRNVKDYFNSKLKLLALSKRAVFNIDDKYVKEAYKEFSGEKASVGIIWHADALARDIVNRGFSGMEYIYREKNRAMKVKLQLAGAYNIYNSLLAIKAAIILGIRPCIAKEAIEGIDKIDGRFEIINSDVHVLIDYAHTPYALECFLRSLNSIKLNSQRLTVVFGCGGARDKTKRPVMGKIAEDNADSVIVTSDNSRNENEADIISDILDGMKLPCKHKVITSRKKAIEHAILSANDGDIIAIIGKGHERYNIDKKGVHPFSEREIIEKCLKKRKNNKL